MLHPFIQKLTEVPVIGLDLDGNNLALAQVTRQGTVCQLVRAEIRNVQAGYPGRLLKKFILEMGFHRCRFAIGISAPEVVARPFSLPRISRKYMDGAIKLEAETAILNSQAINQMVIDWCEIPSNTLQYIRGILAAIPKDLLKTKTAIFKKAGIYPSIVDIKSLAVWNAYWMLEGCRQNTTETTLLLNIESQATNLVVVQGRSDVIMVRDLMLGSDAYHSGRETEFFAEIEDSLAYARSQSGLRQIDKSYITGWGSSSALAGDLATRLSRPVRIWNPLDSLPSNVKNMPARTTGPQLSAAIGLALRKL